MTRTQLPIFRPYQGKGAAFIFNTSVSSAGQFNVFLSSMAEKPEGESFDSSTKINFKLGINDVSDILAFAEGRKDGLGVYKEDTKKWGGLFHKTDNGNSSLSIEPSQDGKSFSIRLSSKPKTGNLTAHNIRLSIADLNLIRHYLTLALPEMFADRYGAETSKSASPQTAVAGKGKAAPVVDEDEVF